MSEHKSAGFHGQVLRDLWRLMAFGGIEIAPNPSAPGNARSFPESPAVVVAVTNAKKRGLVNVDKIFIMGGLRNNEK